MICKLAGSSWGADAKTLRTAALGLVYSAAEYCCSTWLNSSHVQLIDVQLNNVMRKITGCILSTPIPWLSTLSNIAPPNCRRKELTSRLTRKSLALDCSLLSRFLKDIPPDRLKSRRPIQPMLLELSNYNIINAWNEYWSDASVFNNELIDDPTSKPGGFNLKRREWVLLNRLRTGHGKCNHHLAQWNPGIYSSSCDCGILDQTMAHIVLTCPLRRFLGTFKELSDAETPRSTDWLTNLDLLL